MTISRAELTAYLDEALPGPDMARIERALRDSAELRAELRAISAERDQGIESVGAIWRRNRLSCPSRQQLGSYLLDALAADWRDYLDFHLHTVGCRYCLSNLEDLRAHQAAAPPQAQSRRRRYFESSAGYL